MALACSAGAPGSCSSAARWKATPAIEKRLRIEQQDERNRTIADRAKARAYDASLYIFSALMLCFALMRVDLAVILLLVGAYLLVVGINIYYHVKYNREL